MATNGLVPLVWIIGGCALGAGIVLYMNATRAGATEEARHWRRALVYGSILLGLTMLALLALDAPAPNPTGLPRNFDPDARNFDATRASNLSLWLIFANLAGPGSVGVAAPSHARSPDGSRQATPRARFHRVLSLRRVRDDRADQQDMGVATPPVADRIETLLSRRIWRGAV